MSDLGVDVVGALNLVGALVKYLGLAFVFPVAVAAGYGEAAWPFLIAGALTSGFGLGLERLTRGKESVGAREGYLVVSIVWLLVAVFGAIPYVLAEPQLARPVDALFESMSGFSTTGSSVIADLREVSRSMALWRQFTTWIDLGSPERATRARYPVSRGPERSPIQFPRPLEVAMHSAHVRRGVACPMLTRQRVRSGPAGMGLSV